MVKGYKLGGYTSGLSWLSISQTLSQYNFLVQIFVKYIIHFILNVNKRSATDDSKNSLLFVYNTNINIKL